MKRPLNLSDTEAHYLEDLLESDCHSGLGAPALLSKLRDLMRAEGLMTTQMETAARAEGASVDRRQRRKA